MELRLLCRACGGGLGWGLSPRVVVWREPPPGSHLRCEPTSPASGRGAPSPRPDRFNQKSSRSRGSTKRPEKISHFPDIELRLFEGREVAAFRHLAPVPDVGIAGFHPPPHRRDDLFWKYGNAAGYRDLERRPAVGPKT